MARFQSSLADIIRSVSRDFAANWLAIFLICISPASAAPLLNSKEQSALQIAAKVDRLLQKTHDARGTKAAEIIQDEYFLRRVMLDLTGQLPKPEQVTLFGLDPDPAKRSKKISELINTKNYAVNWSRYWRDVIFSRATEQRSLISQQSFEDWLTQQFEQNRPWDAIAKSLLTATGDVRENGATALIFAQGGEPAEIAAEASRIFLGIQIQCANCHDHPSDIWKREQFHELAAFFPRVRVRPVRDAQRRSFEVVSYDVQNASRSALNINPQFLMRNLDRNKDNNLSKSEVANSRLAQRFDRILQLADKNNDKMISLAELKNMPVPENLRRRTQTEYNMPDLSNPSSQGQRMNPVLFTSGDRVASGLTDIARREQLAKQMTNPDNPWFAQAFVNRMWSEMLGSGFSMPVDDLGPSRVASYPEVLKLLSEQFVQQKYDIKWLLTTIANTQAYQRSLQTQTQTADVEFAAAIPTRLRADQIYNTLVTILGTPANTSRSRQRGNNGYRGGNSIRRAFGQLFGYDPSTPQNDITGTVPQALFMMNSPVINNAIDTRSGGKLAGILRDFEDNDEAIAELYLLVLAREPARDEINISKNYIREVGNRSEAFEDLMWSLLNTSEFLSRR